MSEDVVNNPRHYNQNGIEVIDVIETYAKSDFRLANVIKYVCRCEYKGKKLEDLKKAQWYLTRVIEELEEEEKIDFRLDGYYSLVPTDHGVLTGLEDAHVYVQPAADRVAGDDEAASRIKNEYYQWDPDEAICPCADPNCHETIKSSDVPVVDEEGRSFCSLTCAYECAR